MLQQIRFSKLCLRTVRQRLQRPQAFGNFIIAENEGVLGAKLDGAPEGYAEFLFDGRQFDTEAGVAQSFGGAESGGVGAFAHPGDVQRWRLASGEWRLNARVRAALV